MNNTENARKFCVNKAHLLYKERLLVITCQDKEALHRYTSVYEHPLLSFLLKI